MANFDGPDTLKGIVIDRSDWNRVFDLTMDDGVSWVQNHSAYALKHAWVDITSKLRAVGHPWTRGRENQVSLLTAISFNGCCPFLTCAIKLNPDGVMLMNTVG